MAFELLPLPYPMNALEPQMSARTLEFHHGKHHKAYVDNANKLVQDTPLANKPLEEVIQATAKDESKQGLFNNVAQIWNHSFFWKSLRPKGGGRPTGDLARAVEESFGSYEKFREAFKTAGATQFGSGWAWLVFDGGKLKVAKTPNAMNPLVHGTTALLTYDVWEHAYYLDYQNRRPDFIDAFIDHLVNWNFAAENLARARAQRTAAE
ncbi:MAG: superoxide dismutase [Alphaproteobacteria bacterium]|nr:superoxide dismutase [Alphaproteobacteria bacterium]